jgi:hypothetical protein
MAVRVRILDSQGSLAMHEATIAQQEELSFELVALAAGRAGGQNASLLTLGFAAAAPPKIHLMLVDGNLTDREQEALLNTQAPNLVCYGTLFVEGVLRNVAAFR